MKKRIFLAVLLKKFAYYAGGLISKLHQKNRPLFPSLLGVRDFFGQGIYGDCGRWYLMIREGNKTDIFCIFAANNNIMS